MQEFDRPGGHILIARRLFDSDLWTASPATLKIFLALLHLARYQTDPLKITLKHRAQPAVINRGQLFTTVNDLARFAHLSVDQTRTALGALEAGGTITTSDVLRRGTLVTMPRFDRYQRPSFYRREGIARSKRTPPNTFQAQPQASQQVAAAPLADTPNREEMPRTLSRSLSRTLSRTLSPVFIDDSSSQPPQATEHFFPLGPEHNAVIFTESSTERSTTTTSVNGCQSRTARRLPATGVPAGSRKEKTLPQPPKHFDEFWSAYPRKIGKLAAVTAYARALKNDPSCLPKLIPAVQRARLSEQWSKDGGQFIPHPATWLNQGRWDDDPVIATQPAGTAPALDSGNRLLTPIEKAALRTVKP